MQRHSISSTHGGRGSESATHAIVLSETCFYPEGGGQEGDYGSLTTDGTSRQVLDTQKQGDLILHLCDGPFEVGDLVLAQLIGGDVAYIIIPLSTLLLSCT